MERASGPHSLEAELAAALSTLDRLLVSLERPVPAGGGHRRLGAGEGDTGKENPG